MVGYKVLVDSAGKWHGDGKASTHFLNIKHDMGRI